MGGSSTTISTSATRINALQVQSSASGKPIAWLAGRNRISPNLIYYSDFEAVAHTTKKKSGGKGGGGATQKDTTYTYYAALILAIGRGPMGTIHRIFRDKEVFAEAIIDGVTQSALAQAGFSFAQGARDQLVWGFLQTNHPAEAIAYSDTAYVYSSRYPCSQAGQLWRSLRSMGRRRYSLAYADARAGQSLSPGDVGAE
jgi:hypothetical protein